MPVYAAFLVFSFVTPVLEWFFIPVLPFVLLVYTDGVAFFDVSSLPFPASLACGLDTRFFFPLIPVALPVFSVAPWLLAGFCAGAFLTACFLAGVFFTTLLFSSPIPNDNCPTAAAPRRLRTAGGFSLVVFFSPRFACCLLYTSPSPRD